MAKVLLIYPYMRVITPLFPYSLLPIAGKLREAGHEVRVLDAQVEELRDVDPAAFDVVGISTLSGYQIAGALKAAAYVRERAPGATLVWGGVHPSLAPAQTVMDPLVDVVVRGEGELTLLALLQALDAGRSLQEVSGLTLLLDGEVLHTPDTPFLDMDSLPFSDYSLIKTERYPHYAGSPSWVYYESSRGCPNNCGFCYNLTMHKRKWRSKSVSRVLDELAYIKDTLGPDSIFPIDDNFSVNKQRVELIASGMAERGLVLAWPMNSRFDYAASYDDEFLQTLRRSGCTQISFGGESGSARMLDKMCKGITPEMMRRTAVLLKRNEVESGVMFMAGFPGERDEDLRATLDLIDELVDIYPLLEPRITIYTPFPGTALYGEAIAGGFRDPGSLAGWSRFGYGLADNCAWLDRRHRDMLRTIALLSVFDFTARRTKSRRLFSDRKALSLVHRLYSADARWRWRHRFFRLAPEWRLLDLALKRLKLWHR
jgi:radical SAM superfamily enzyme YgiQ (UPF0313 family)